MTKIYSLVFDYNISKMQSSGRHWADEAYKNKDYIFQYSAASIATFLDKNPHLRYDVLTDDVDLLAQKIDAYSVSTANLVLTDTSDKISEWTQHWYCFWPLIQVADVHYTGEDHALKLDNDLTCHGNIDMMLRSMDDDVAWMWKHERLCSKGRDYWGESYAACEGLGTDNFHIYNTGVLGVPKSAHVAARKIKDYCEKLISVDISTVHRFPDKPGVVSKVFNTSDQVAVNFFFHQEGLKVMPAHHFFDHHCYDKSKAGVMQGAEHLRRKR